MEFGVTVNSRGNYYKVRAERTTNIQPGETSKRAFRRAWDEVEGQVESELKTLGIGEDV